MAATAAAAVASSFSSSSVNTLKCIRSILFPSDHLHLRISSPTRLLASPSSHSFATLEPLSTSQKWRVLRTTAAVAQEEVALTAEVGEETELVEEKEEEWQGEEGKKAAEEAVQSPAARGEAAAAGDEVSALNTKLYFGNLPYSVDSAQLAGIIQDYASPEMVEVSEYRGSQAFFLFFLSLSLKFVQHACRSEPGSHFLDSVLRYLIEFTDVLAIGSVMDLWKLL